MAVKLRGVHLPQFGPCACLGQMGDGGIYRPWPSDLIGAPCRTVADGLHGKKVGVLGEKGRGDLAPTVGVFGFESGLQGAKSDAGAQLWECTSDFAVSRDLDQGGEENRAGPPWQTGCQGGSAPMVLENCRGAVC